MRANGNGAPNVCASNLLRLIRGEVPYERIKGLDPRMIDKPITTAEPEIQQDAEWLLETYEPRVTMDGISVAQNDTGGGYVVTADVTENT
nr:MAG TPA: lysozyme [Caudoviricetes sp.]